VGYRWYTDPSANVNNYQPRYAFGFGLSYTTFAYSGLSVKNTADGGLDVSFTVKNTGNRAGSDSAQVYIGASPDLKAPVYDANGLVIDGFQQSAQKLVQFGRVDLAVGASQSLTLHVGPQDVSAWDTVAQKWVLGTGARTVSIGKSSVELPLSVVKNVVLDTTAPTVTIVAPANPTRSTSWNTVSGTITDTGSGPESVTVKLVEQRGNSYYSYDGSSWTKRASLADANAKATAIQPTITAGKWSIPVNDLKTGTLMITYSGTDEVGNTSAPVTVSYQVH